MKLTGKKALITGGNSGIGLATARLFVAEGAKTAITGRDRKTLDEAVAELGPNARGYRADVTVADDRKRLFADLARDFGKLDIVFANAGISGRTPTGATDEAVFETIVHTNLNGAFFTINAAVPLLNDNASIIFNGSVHNYIGQAGLAAYAATKGGVVAMARAIAADLRAAQHSRQCGRTRSYQNSYLEARVRRLGVGRTVRQAGRFLLLDGSSGAMGRT